MIAENLQPVTKVFVAGVGGMGVGDVWTDTRGLFRTRRYRGRGGCWGELAMWRGCLRVRLCLVRMGVLVRVGVAGRVKVLLGVGGVVEVAVT